MADNKSQRGAADRRQVAGGKATKWTPLHASMVSARVRRKVWSRGSETIGKSSTPQPRS